MRVMRYAAVMAAGLTLMCAVPVFAQATADQKTQFTFSEPVMVPGTTLQPGQYTFRLVDQKTTQQLVQIVDASGKVIVTTPTVPLKRNATNVTGDGLLRFNPTDRSGPVALKGWFYPGMMYGHEFVYPDAEARQIAQRTKTIVLSSDMANGQGRAGRLYTYDASGNRAAWAGEPEATASVRTAPATDDADATAPMMTADRQGMHVKVNQLEEHAQEYVGKKVSVDAEVDEVLGPRLFKIDEPDWADLDPEVLVYMPTDLAALVRRGDRVTVSGTVKPFMKTEIAREFGWMDESPDLIASLSKRPILVADRIVGGDNHVAMTIEVGRPGQTASNATSGTPGATSGEPVGTKGTTPSAGATTRGAAVTDLQSLATGGSDLVGRHVDLDGVTVASRAQHGNGFWLRGASGTNVYVLPAHADTVSPDNGPTVSVSGVVLEMPRSMRDQFRATPDFNDSVYVYASQVTG